MPKNRGLHDRESKRDDIVAAARHMFVSDGFERASISRLAKAVGITPNTVYWYFDDKDDILVAVLTAIAAEDAADYATVADRSLADRLVWLVEQLQRVGPLVSTVHDRVAKSAAIEHWHNGFHHFAESLFASDIEKAGLSGSEADAMLRIGTFVVEGLLTHAPAPEVVRSVIDRLVATIPPVSRTSSIE
ncbi:TetR/AcrR family transcriptional regulator [Rhodococcus sp. IEGM 1354]|uniref:TetR/AcrR family transcriptional regulator n=1 Tax=Rhodococcus sp. IEGM 1354 TaxID=3047088 RepID=UPI0024B7CB0F|nr:TetR/AcrR family transcriptional regulator [Rhodococcus sp. IEGM 1354]MDI9933471.1 TetR/AcrR family transcriptional regulator [Rhodococcus sp. IEGM 1354]